MADKRKRPIDYPQEIQHGIIGNRLYPEPLGRQKGTPIKAKAPMPHGRPDRLELEDWELGIRNGGVPQERD